MASADTHASFTGSIPENYDTYLGPLLFEFSAADMATRVARALDGPARVLEVACGTGISTRHLAGALAAGSEICATDLNPAMLEHAAKVNGDLPGVRYATADALDLPDPDDSYDAVVCQFGIMFFPDKLAGMKEMYRVLKPGGLVAVNVWDSFEQNPAVGIVDRVIKEAFADDPPSFLELPFGFHDLAAGEALLAAAGFQTVVSDHVGAAVDVADHADAARGFITGNPTILEIEARAAVDAEDIIGRAGEALARAFGPAPAKLPFRAVVFTARKP